ncbi:hypothetical protein ACJX0J_019683, partial [Zea mays]
GLDTVITLLPIFLFHLADILYSLFWLVGRGAGIIWVRVGSLHLDEDKDCERLDQQYLYPTHFSDYHLGKDEGMLTPNTNL